MGVGTGGIFFIYIAPQLLSQIMLVILLLFSFCLSSIFFFIPWHIVSGIYPSNFVFLSSFHSFLSFVVNGLPVPTLSFGCESYNEFIHSYLPTWHKPTFSKKKIPLLNVYFIFCLLIQFLLFTGFNFVFVLRLLNVYFSISLASVSCQETCPWPKEQVTATYFWNLTNL